MLLQCVEKLILLHLLNENMEIHLDQQDEVPEIRAF